MRQYMITYDRDLYDKQKLSDEALIELIEEHKTEILPAIEEAQSYYFNDTAEDVKCNHAKDIADTAAGYFLGSPITYKPRKAAKIDTLQNVVEMTNLHTIDQTNALNLSICGRAFEYWYPQEGEAELGCKATDPAVCFVVYDSTIKHDPLCSVYYYIKATYDKKGKKKEEITYATVSDADTIKDYKISNSGVELINEQDNLIGVIPIIEAKNNEYCVGDFEQQISLIDAYNRLASDRIQSVDEFIDAILVLKGARFGDSEDESDDAVGQAQRKKYVELPEGSDLSYLTRTLDQGDMSTLRKEYKEDIYTFSHVPNLTDENFAGNSSGVAMEYKLLGLEMLTKTKESFYREFLHKRLHLINEYYSKKNMGFDPHEVQIVFSRGLPRNLQELADIVTELKGSVSLKTLLSILPFVDNVEDELKALQAEKEAENEAEKDLYSAAANTTPEELKEETPPEDKQEEELEE